MKSINAYYILKREGSSISFRNFKKSFKMMNEIHMEVLGCPCYRNWNDYLNDCRLSLTRGSDL